MATVYTDLIPRGAADEALAAAEQESVVLALGNVIRMREGLESVPVVSVAPVVDFVTPTYGGKKPMTTIEWTAEQLQPVELAATLAIPDAFISDSGFPAWESVRVPAPGVAAPTRRPPRRGSGRRSRPAHALPTTTAR